MSDCLQPYGLQPARLLCPWDSQVRILEWVALLQGIFPIQGLNLHLLGLLHWQSGSLPVAPLGKLNYSHGQIQLAFVSKVLLEHSHDHVLTHCLWLPSCHNSKIELLYKARGLPLWLSVSSASAGDTGSILEPGRSRGGGCGNPHQCSCLGNPMDRGTWRATVHRILMSWTDFSD